MFIRLLIGLISAFNHTKCVSLSNQKCEIQPTFTNLHPNECSQEFHCYPFTVKSDKCVGNCNTLNGLSNKVCVPNKTKNLSLSVFIMITAINELKTLTRHVSRECKYKFDERKFNSNQWWNNDKCQCECKKHHTCEKDYIWNPSTCICKNEKYLASIMDESVVIPNKAIEKTIPRNFTEKKASCKGEISIFYLHFY